jgi:periplasmic protein CpxP/Spy
MNHASKHLIAAALLALGLAAGAQTPPAAAPAAPGASASHHGMARHHGRFDPVKMQERMAKRQAVLKQKLQLAPTQEAAWTAYTAAMQPPANLQRPKRAELRAEFEKLTTPERIDRMRALRTARLAEMDKRAEATKTFYAGLTPEQKKVFDAETLRRGGRRGGRHHRS